MENDLRAANGESKGIQHLLALECPVVPHEWLQGIARFVKLEILGKPVHGGFSVLDGEPFPQKTGYQSPEKHENPVAYVDGAYGFPSFNGADDGGRHLGGAHQ